MCVLYIHMKKKSLVAVSEFCVWDINRTVVCYIYSLDDEHTQSGFVYILMGIINNIHTKSGYIRMKYVYVRYSG